MTYRELAERAESLATALVAAGVLPGGIVALSLSDPVDLIVGMVGAVRAGGAYLALDPDLPELRRRQLLEDASRRSWSSVPGGLRPRRPPLPMPRRAIRMRPRDGCAGGTVQIDLATVAHRAPAAAVRRLPELTGDDLAAVYFTSGSTGRPKGVPLPHRGVTRLFSGAAPMDLGAGTRMAHAAIRCSTRSRSRCGGRCCRAARSSCSPGPSCSTRPHCGASCGPAASTRCS